MKKKMELPPDAFCGGMLPPVRVEDDDGNEIDVKCRCGARLKDEGLMGLMTLGIGFLTNRQETLDGVSRGEMLCLQCRIYEKAKEASEGKPEP